jgi:hypothetical protein
MRRPLVWLCGAISIPVFALPVNAQLELIMIERPFHARALSGVVVDPSGAPIPGVVVEECDASFSPRPLSDPGEKPSPMTMLWDCDRDSKHIVATVTTDANGRFAFPQAKEAKVHYLHLSLNGFDPMEIVVIVSRFARTEPRIKMTIAT